MIKALLTHELLSQQLTVCLAAILNILIFKIAQMVVLNMDFIIKAVLKSSKINSLSNMVLMEVWSKISHYFIKISNFFYI